VNLQQGANAPLTGDTARVTLSLPRVAGVEIDVSAYLLGADGKVGGDADMVFYNQPTGGAGAITLADGVFTVALARVPPAVERIVFCATIDEAVVRRQTLALLAGAYIEVAAGETLRFAPLLTGATEAAMIFGELYRRQNAWKFRAVGQGFNGGLAPLARSFGIDVADGPPLPPITLPPPPPPLPPAPVRLTKVTLDKPRQTISLDKPTGDIVVNLNWSRGKGVGAVDLDLGCLFELADGWKSVVQALGGTFGSLTQEPWIALSGDDRSGDIASGETMRVSAVHWGKIRRVLVFAMIYEGAPNWQATDGVVTVQLPGQPTIEVRMTEGRNDRRLCAVAMLENVAGAFTATRLVDYHTGQRKLDEAFGWGLRWTAGSKD
jgi:tellurite resistance protein TerA